MGKVLHRVFSTIVSEISQELTNFGESGSEVSHFIPEPRNFVEVTKLAENIRKPWLIATLKDINNLINNQTFIIEDPKDGESLVIDEIIYLLKSSFQPSFLIFSANLVTSAKFLGSGMKWETSEPDYSKLANSCEISNTIVLNTICKPFQILCVALNAPFHCDLFCLILSRIQDPYIAYRDRNAM